jgi:hypothetical protein
MFKSDFAPDAIAAGAETAARFGSVVPFLNRVMADAVAELQAIKSVADSADCSAYEKQFCGPRAVEAFVAFNTCRRLLDAHVQERELVNA